MKKKLEEKVLRSSSEAAKPPAAWALMRRMCVAAGVDLFDHADRESGQCCGDNR